MFKNTHLLTCHSRAYKLMKGEPHFPHGYLLMNCLRWTRRMCKIRLDLLLLVWLHARHTRLSRRQPFCISFLQSENIVLYDRFQRQIIIITYVKCFLAAFTVSLSPGNTSRSSLRNASDTIPLWPRRRFVLSTLGGINADGFFSVSC